MNHLPASILDHIGRTPLVPLNRIVAGLQTPVLGKCENLNPGGSIKDRSALAIVADAEKRGILMPGATRIEATAGNTGVGLALVAAVRGYSLVCVLPEEMSQDKRNALSALGARMIIIPNAPPHSPIRGTGISPGRGWSSSAASDSGHRRQGEAQLHLRRQMAGQDPLRAWPLKRVTFQQGQPPEVAASNHAPSCVFLARPRSATGRRR